LPEISTSRVLTALILESVWVLIVAKTTGGNVTDTRFIHCLRSGRNASIYEGWNFNSGNYLFTTDTK